MSRFGFNSRYDSSSSPGISANQSFGSSGSGMNFWQKLWKWLSGGYYAEHNNGFLAFVKQVGGYATDEEARAALASEHSDTFMSRFFGNPLGAVSEEVSNIFGESGPLSGLGNLISSLASRIAGTNLTGAEREANEFTAQQAQINRSFQSAEAEKAREWQEEQYLKYNSPAAQMQQFRDAGINPIMVAGGNMPAASTSTAAPSGSAGSSVSPSAPVDLISGIISILKTKAEIDNIKSQTNLNNANASESSTRSEINLTNLRTLSERNSLELDKIRQDIASGKASELLSTANISKVEAETSLTLYQAMSASIDASYRERLNDASLALSSAETSLASARERGVQQEIRESRKRVSEMDANISKLRAEALEVAANTNKINQETKNLMVEEGILQYSREQNRFIVDHQSADRIIRNATTIADSYSRLRNSRSASLGVGASLIGTAAKLIK